MMRKSTSVKTIPANPGPANVSTPAAFEDPKLAVQTEPSHPLNEFTDPSLLLVGRLEKWKHNINLILRYAESHASSQASLTSGLEKTCKIFQDQHQAGSEPEAHKSGIDEVLGAIFVETEGLLRASEIAATNIKQSVIPPLEELLAEIDQHHREIKDNSVSAMKDIEKLRIHTFKHMETLNGVVNSGAIPTENRDDPYIVKRQMVGVLNSQLGRENDHARNVVAIQTNFAKFDSKVVQTIQTSLRDLEAIVSEYNNSSTNAHRAVSEKYSAVEHDQDWNVFQESNKDVFLPTKGFQRDPANLEFENKDHIYTKAIIEGPLNRKARVLRSLQLGFYVLTPSGFLHGFKSEDAIKDPLPEVSLFVPECEIEPLDPRTPDEFKIYGKDRSSKLGTRRNYVFRTLNAGDAQLWHEALYEVSHDITNASVGPVAPVPVPVAASSPSRGFASVPGTTSAATASSKAGAAGTAGTAGAAGAAGAIGAVGVGAVGAAALSRNRNGSNGAAPLAPEYDDTEVQSLREPDTHFFTEDETERRSSSPLAATAAATTLGISPRMRAQSPFQSYRNHSNDQFGESYPHEAHDDIAPISLTGEDVAVSQQPLARKLDFEEEPKKSHAYNALAVDSAAAPETNDFVEPSHKIEVEPIAPVTVETAGVMESLEPVDPLPTTRTELEPVQIGEPVVPAAEFAESTDPLDTTETAFEHKPIDVEPVGFEPKELELTDPKVLESSAHEQASALGETAKVDTLPEAQNYTTEGTPTLGDVDYDVGKAVGIADAANAGEAEETGFAEQKDILTAQGYAVNGLGTEHKSLEDDELQREATIRAQKNSHQTNMLTGLVDGESTTVFTESGEPLVVGKTTEEVSGPYFSEPAGEPIFTGAGQHSDPPKPANSGARDELVSAGAIPAKQPAEINASDPVPVQAAKAATATAPAIVPDGPPTPPTYNKDLAPPPATLSKTETSNSITSTKSKRFSKRFMSKLKHGFKHREKAEEV